MHVARLPRNVLVPWGALADLGQLIYNKLSETSVLALGYVVIDDQNLSRRQLLSVLCAASLASTNSGCIFLLRLFVGRGLARGLLRGSRLGGRHSLNTLGRGLSLGWRAARLSRQSRVTTEVYDIENRYLAKVYTEEGKIHCIDDNNNRLMVSLVERSHVQHYVFSGSYVGRSRYVDDYTTVHYDEDDRYIGYDMVSEGEKFVEHFDRRKKSLGKSKLVMVDGKDALIADEALQQTIEALEKSTVFTCEEAKKEYEDFRRLQQLCVDGSTQACYEKRLAYTRLINRINHHCHNL